MSTKVYPLTLTDVMNRPVPRKRLREARDLIALAKLALRQQHWDELAVIFRHIRWWPNTPVCRQLSALNARLDEINSYL